MYLELQQQQLNKHIWDGLRARSLSLYPFSIEYTRERERTRGKGEREYAARYYYALYIALRAKQSRAGLGWTGLL